MVITKPTLPAKAGYVEVEINGKRVYRPTPETEAQNDMDAMLVDYEFRLTLLELGLTEY